MREPRFSASPSGCGVYDWREPSDGPSAGGEPAIVLCHATGFHARIWDQVVAAIPGHRSIALDLPGHGRAVKMEPPARWLAFGEAVAAAGTELALEGTIGVGHSMGGHSVVVAAGRNPGLFAGLILIDPVIRPPEKYGTPRTVGHYAAKRRNEWASAEEMFARFESRPPFDRWDRAVLKDYCDYALNGNVLACPPAFEASVYENSTHATANVHAIVQSLKIPVLVIRAPGALADGVLDMSASPTDPKLASRFPNAREEVWADCSHFIPMEQPVRVASSIVQFISRIRRVPGDG